MRVITFLCVVLVSACTSGGWQRIGPRQYAIECEEPLDCYRYARTVCPYGFEISDKRVVSGNGELTVHCRPPTFCESQPCPNGARCVESKRYEGRRVCSVR